jgi:hypothetical protein
VLNQTKPRQLFWQWINTAGRNFINMPEGEKTNYLSAYKKSSNFIEKKDNASTITGRGQADGEESDASKALGEAAVEKRERRPNPRQISYDDRPFPNNPKFKSQAILSEALRLEVWKRVQVDGQSVRRVSADLQIDMQRVGAVVRLVEVEKRMRAEVSPTLRTAFPPVS